MPRWCCVFLTNASRLSRQRESVGRVGLRGLQGGGAAAPPPAATSAQAALGRQGTVGTGGAADPSGLGTGTAGPPQPPRLLGGLNELHQVWLPREMGSRKRTPRLEVTVFYFIGGASNHVTVWVPRHLMHPQCRVTPPSRSRTFPSAPKETRCPPAASRTPSPSLATAGFLSPWSRLLWPLP